jgi:putative Mg2+ transporter-C (MgtC) family protein
VFTFSPEDIRNISAIAIAGGLGAAIGVEREIAGKPAGMRTHLLVSAASALMMCLGDSIIQSYHLQGNISVDADPIRVIQAIVVGISFLGAGTIIHERGERVEGLTTAASIFVTTGIGIAVAVGRTTLAISMTVLVILVLVVLGRVEAFLIRRAKAVLPEDHPKKDPLRPAAHGIDDRVSPPTEGLEQ